jgi:hypothetical protein
VVTARWSGFTGLCHASPLPILSLLRQGGLRKRKHNRSQEQEGRTAILRTMRFYSLLFGLISLVVLVMFLIYVIRGPVDPLIAGGLFVSFLACVAPALILLKPTSEPSEELKRRQEARKERARRRGFTDDPPRGPKS